MIFSSKELAKAYAEKNYYPDSYKIEETNRGNFRIKRFYCCVCNTTSDLNHIRDEIYICTKCVGERGK